MRDLNLRDAEGHPAGFLRCPISDHVIFVAYADASKATPTAYFQLRRATDGIEYAQLHQDPPNWNRLQQSVMCMRCRQSGENRIFDENGQAMKT